MVVGSSYAVYRAAARRNATSKSQVKARAWCSGWIGVGAVELPPELARVWCGMVWCGVVVYLLRLFVLGVSVVMDGASMVYLIPNAGKDGDALGE